LEADGFPILQDVHYQQMKWQWPDKMTVDEFQFADDFAAVSTSRTKIEKVAPILQGLLKDWGLTMSLTKTKLLVVGSTAPRKP